MAHFCCSHCACQVQSAPRKKKEIEKCTVCFHRYPVSRGEERTQKACHGYKRSRLSGRSFLWLGMLCHTALSDAPILSQRQQHSHEEKFTNHIPLHCKDENNCIDPILQETREQINSIELRGKQMNGIKKSNWEHVVLSLQAALINANSQIKTQTVKNSDHSRHRERLRWKNRWDSFRNSVSDVASTASSTSGMAHVANSATIASGMAHVANSATIAAAAMAAASVEREIESVGNIREQNPKLSLENTQSAARDGAIISQKPMMGEHSKHHDFDSETEQGARLLSASFGVISNTFGLLADSVRVVGHTAAGVTGSSVKLVGTAVKTISAGLDGASRLLEPTDLLQTGQDRPRKQLTSERLMDRQNWDSWEGQDERRRMGVVGNTRNVAAKSVRLLGTVVRGVGESVVLAGAATESVAASTAGVAEDAVRIIESFAGSLSAALNLKKRHPSNTSPFLEDVGIDLEYDFPEGASPTFLSYGTFSDEEIPEPVGAPSLTPSFVHRLMTSKRHSSIMAVFDIIAEQSTELFNSIMADTEGIPSFATELLGVLFLCYLATLLTLSKSRKPETNDVKGSQPKGYASRWNGVLHLGKYAMKAIRGSERAPLVLRRDIIVDTDSAPDQESTDISSVQSQSKGLLIKKEITQQDMSEGTETRMKMVPIRILKRILLLLWKIIRATLRALLGFLFGRHTVLIMLHAVAWLYLCRASQLRSLDIHRNGEGMGFRSAISSIGTTSPSVAESVVWFNAFLKQIWRVEYDHVTGKGKNLSSKVLFPQFVTRAVQSSLQGSEPSVPYGGLEPNLSSIIGTSILDSLDSTNKASRPSDIAYVSLYSFTMGDTPPLIRSVELQGVKNNGGITQFTVDVDAILDDLSLVLEVKLSSLEYALIPSTKISIHSIEMRLPLELSLSTRPDYPYVSKLRMSLANTPDCKLRITPLSNDSGLRGVNVASLPVISDWVRDAIRENLSDYVSPKYVAINLGEYFSPTTGSATPRPTRPDITHLRQKTKQALNPNPRTSGGASWTSLADHLPSHRSATGAAGYSDNTYFVKPVPGAISLVRPKTELAQMGLERWTSKMAEVRVEERQNKSRIVEMITRPLSIVSPFAVAMAAGVFRDTLFREVDDEAVIELSS